MNILTAVLVAFSAIAAIDRLFGGKLAMGREFEKGFRMLGSMALSMIGIIVLTPFLKQIMEPCFDFIYKTFKVDPSALPAALLANDMGGAELCKEVAMDSRLGSFNGLIVSSMMGCTISFSIPVSMETVKKEKQREMLLGYLCGIVTIPLGCFFAGLALRIPLDLLIVDLLPISIFAGIIVCGLLFCPSVCVKVFEAIGWIIRLLITVGLTLGILKMLLDIEPIKGLKTLEEGAIICVNAAVVMTGAFPLIMLVSKLVRKPLEKIGKLMNINETSAMGLIATLATAMSTYEMMNDMDKKGVLLNAAFLVSAGFTFAGHLAFTMAFQKEMISFMLLGKLAGGLMGLLLALLLYPKICKGSK